MVNAQDSSGFGDNGPRGTQVLVTDPAELEKIRERESSLTKERINKILASGANVVLTTKGIDDMSLKYFVEAGVIACRRVSKEDMKCVLPTLLSPDCTAKGNCQTVSWKAHRS